MKVLLEKVRSKIEGVLTSEINDVNGRYIDTLTRLHEAMFWADRKLKEKNS